MTFRLWQLRGVNCAGPSTPPKTERLDAII